jgi:hypothetical protein
MVATDSSEETASLKENAVENIEDGQSAESPPALKDEIFLTAERSDENDPLILKEGDDVVDEENAESPSWKTFRLKSHPRRSNP